MICESEVNQEILSRTDFCFNRTEFCFNRTEFYLFSGAYRWEFLSIFTGAIIVFAILNSNIQLPINAFHSSRLAKKVFSGDISGLEPIAFLEKGARVMLTMNLLSTAYWDSC